MYCDVDRDFATRIPNMVAKCFLDYASCMNHVETSLLLQNNRISGLQPCCYRLLVCRILKLPNLCTPIVLQDCFHVQWVLVSLFHGN